ncbi:expressed unknown protein [Seminavis robusta]|uniref:Uncharacterized protein n=1 Tax=Seminavis robusta TaxID=568900 RepID=A0A9N8EXU3_9STRA|nr:expressed unknown protein [Seminavis robusta]|eukprot:Sro2203_g318930.1 n/a (622) ;mRNA; f:1802-3667
MATISPNNDSLSAESNPRKRRKLNCGRADPSGASLQKPRAESGYIQTLMQEPILEFTTEMPGGAIDTGQETPWANARRESSWWEDVVQSLGGSGWNQDFENIISGCDRAWAFVEELKQLYDKLGGGFKSLWGNDAFDVVFALAEQMITAQNQMQSLGCSTKVDIGYHYTTDENLIRIRQRGLLTRAERLSLGIHAKDNGKLCGDGVYTGNNPFAFCARKFGGVGLFVARLRGRELDVTRCYGSGRQQWNPDEHDSKAYGEGINQMVILRASGQCMPLVAYQVSLLDEVIDNMEDAVPGKGDNIFDLHLKLQALIDKHFNEGEQTSVQRVAPSAIPRRIRNRRRRVRQLQQARDSVRPANHVYVHIHVAGQDPDPSRPATVITIESDSNNPVNRASTSLLLPPIYIETKQPATSAPTLNPPIDLVHDDRSKDLLPANLSTQQPQAVTETSPFLTPSKAGADNQSYGDATKNTLDLLKNQISLDTKQAPFQSLPVGTIPGADLSSGRLVPATQNQPSSTAPDTLLQRLRPVGHKQAEGPGGGTGDVDLAGISLQAVREVLLSHNGEMEFKPLLRMFRVGRKSPKARIDHFRALCKELCLRKADPTGGRRVLSLKPNWRTSECD